MGDNAERDSFDQEKQFSNNDDKLLQSNDLSTMISTINNYKIDLSNESERKLVKRFLDKVKNWWKIKTDIDADDVDFWNRAAFQKVLKLVKAYQWFSEERTEIWEYSENEIALLKSFVSDKKNIQDEAELRLSYLKEWTKYNSIDVNSAINAIKKWIVKGKATNEFKDFLVKINNYAEKSRDSNSYLNIDASILKYKWYAFVKPEWSHTEIIDLGKFMKEQLGFGYDSLIINWTIDDKKAKELYDKFETIKIDDSIRLSDLQNPLDSWLWYIADFGWVDQWQKPDWILRAENSKTYGSFLSRIFTGWEWAQKRSVSEIQVFNKLKEEISSVGELKAKIIELVYNWNDAWDVNSIFASNDINKIKVLLDKFVMVWLWRVAETKNLESFTDKNHSKEVIRLANNSLDNIKEIAKEFKSRPEYTSKINEITSNFKVPKTEAEKLLENWTISVLSSPEITFWLSQIITKNINIDRVFDHLWNLLTESKTSSTKMESKPYLVIGMNIASFRDRIFKEWQVSYNWWLSMNWIVGLKGLALPLNWNAWVWVTVNDRNYIEAWELKWNWKVIIWGSLWYDLLENWNLVKMAHIDLNWNTKIDAIEKNIYKNKRLLVNLLDNKGKFDSENWIKDTKNAVLEARHTIKWDTEQEKAKKELYLNILETNLNQLDSVMKNIPDWENKENLQNIILTNWIDAVQTEYAQNIKDATSWINWAWLRIGYIFWVSLLSIGLNFENIEWAYKMKWVESRLKSYEKQRWATFDSSKEIEAIKKMITWNNWDKEIKVPSYIEIVNANTNDITTIEDIDEKLQKITSSNPIYYNILEKRAGTWSTRYKIEVSNTPFNPKWKNEVLEISSKVEAKNIGSINNEIKGILWNGFDINKFEKLLSVSIHWEGKGGNVEYFKELMKAIEIYQNNPLTWSDKLKIVIREGKKSFQGNNEKLAGLDNEKLSLLASYIMKLSMKDWAIQQAIWKDGKLDLSKANKDNHLKSVKNAESNLLTNLWFNPDTILSAKINALAKENIKTPLERATLSSQLWKTPFDKILSAVVSTPKWVDFNHRLTTLPDLDPTVFWKAEDIWDKNTQDKIIKFFGWNIEKAVTEINKKLPKWVSELTQENYIALIKWGDVPLYKNNDWTIYKFSMSLSQFKSFNVWFEWNECFNAWFGLVLWKLKLERVTPDWKVSTFENFSEVADPYGKLDQTTVWVSINTVRHTNTTIKEDYLPEPKKPETWTENTWTENTWTEDTWTEDTWTEDTWTEDTWTETLPINENPQPPSNQEDQ